MNRRQLLAVFLTLLVLLCIVAPDVMRSLGQLLRDMATLIVLGK